MKFTSHFILAAAVLLLFNFSAKAQQAAQDSLNLQDAIHAALTNQPSLDQVEAEINASESQTDQAKTAYYPQVEAEGSYNYLSPVSTLDFNGSGFQVMPKSNYDAHVAAHQLIYDFGKTRQNIALARSRTLTAEQRREVVKWTISYYTTKTFYSILYLDQSMEVVAEQIKTLNEDLDTARKRLQNGSATNYDVLSIKVRIGEEKNRRLDLIDQKEKLKSTLRKLFGWDPDRTVDVKGNLDLKNEEDITNLNQVYADRPDYKVLQQKKEELKKAYKLRSLSDMPSLTAGVIAGFKNGYQPNIDKILGNYSIGVQLKVPIFNGHTTRYQRQEVQSNINSLNAQSRKLKREIQEEVEQAKTDVKTGKQKLATSDLQIKQAKEQLRLAKIRYKNGVITNTDLLAAETALTKARFQKVTTTYNILLSQYDLKKAAGEKIWTSN
ncbi:MAG TPA: TolC family protein [Balneolaceae bacterium]|nr:TolC family protein [Balneolaceae bacterium]